MKQSRFEIVIYHNNELVQQRSFSRQLMIVRRKNDLQVQCDEETDQPGGGSVELWAHATLQGYQISFLLPSWTMRLDNELYASDAYWGVPIDTKRVELICQPYRFIVFKAQSIENA